MRHFRRHYHPITIAIGIIALGIVYAAIVALFSSFYDTAMEYWARGLAGCLIMSLCFAGFMGTLYHLSCMHRLKKLQKIVDHLSFNIDEEEINEISQASIGLKAHKDKSPMEILTIWLSEREIEI